MKYSSSSVLVQFGVHVRNINPNMSASAGAWEFILCSVAEFDLVISSYFFPSLFVSFI